MKHTFTFGLQVFTTLILFMAIFVTYLERGEVKQSEQPQQEIIDSEVGGKQQLASLSTVSFTSGEVVSCGK